MTAVGTYSAICLLLPELWLASPKLMDSAPRISYLATTKLKSSPRDGLGIRRKRANCFAVDASNARCGSSVSVAAVPSYTTARRAILAIVAACAAFWTIAAFLYFGVDQLAGRRDVRGSHRRHGRHHCSAVLPCHA